MDIFLGFMLCLFLEMFIWGTVKMARRLTPPPPEPQPRAATQLANEAVYEDQTRYHPRVVSMRVQRRTARGRRRLMMEREKDKFED